jgi:murein DD-endopeptidase MepM/ murein hydrolase activator NlpD
MFDFLKRLFHHQYRKLTFVIFDDEQPESSTSYHFKPAQLWMLFYGSLASVIVLTLLVMMFTPLGGLLYNLEDATLRNRVIEVSKRVQALQDSLQVRDAQLYEIQQVIALGSDTSFAVDMDFSTIQNISYQKNWELNSFSEVSTSGMLSGNKIIFSKIFKKAPEFPTSYPLNGTLTRGYNAVNGHYGIDIATKQGSSFKAIADGTVIDQSWTINYGFVIHVQHNNGIVTVYKHVTNLTKSIGDLVLQGDILGTIGDVGILSSGPHLHFEIWKDGVPQNPKKYLIK